jgi:predicted transcriptional regulator of viral defense system
MTKRAKITGPNWDTLWKTAEGQAGMFTTGQAEAAGYSRALLAKYLRGHRIEHRRRGVYRVVHFPAGEHEDLVELWLWADRQAVFSHETALALHGLSDALPARSHLTLPASWETRRLRTPSQVDLHFSDVGKPDKAWVGPVPVTSVARTIVDCADAKVPPDIVKAAVESAIARGLVARKAIAGVEEYLNQFSPQRGRNRRVSAARSG